MTTKNERHQKRMKRQKEVVDQAIAQATEERGIIVLLTGNGKGKSSSAFGMAARALGHGQRVAVVQFLKGAMSTGEELFFSQQKNITWHAMGDGFTWETQNREQDTASAQKAFNQVQTFLQDDAIDLVILDEITYMYKFGYLELEPLLQALNSRPMEQSVVITGRGAKSELIEIADTVSILEDNKHAFRAGVAARKGVEF